MKAITVAAIFWSCLLLATGTTHVAHAVEQTQIDGEFEGCEFNKVYPLMNGRLLVCREYFYEYAYSPEVIDLGGGRAVINGEVHEASVEDGKIVRTHVEDEFEGCDYDKIIAFDNGLLFQCGMYHYHYRYRPEVLIIFRGSRYTVYIDGDEYRGQLLQRK